LVPVPPEEMVIQLFVLTVLHVQVLLLAVTATTPVSDA